CPNVLLQTGQVKQQRDKTAMDEMENSVTRHYSVGDLQKNILDGLKVTGIDLEQLTIDDLSTVDEFHIGGRKATEYMISKMPSLDNGHLLDVGSGIGGAARTMAVETGCKVTGIDLTPEYVEVARTLTDLTRLDDLVRFEIASALSMPFADGALDGGYMIHVGMNIADKAALFREIYRVLRPGSHFGVYDVMCLNDGDLSYPVPWANDDSTSSLASPAEYRQLMADAGFVVMAENNRHDFALSFFQDTIAKTKVAGGPPTLGLHVLIGATTAAKMKNMIENISAGYITPMEIIAQKQE
ncbi:MAG: class I SAM-dependent methyltransferase, partial [Emcibacter sp.]|nr:class I SAM-dependent methyltransferase [Emcibacter sp.]